MVLFDTHCHLDDEAFDEDREAVISRAIEQGLQYMVCPGVNLDSSKKVQDLAAKYPQIYCAVGIHPEDAFDITDDMYDTIERWAAENPKVVAIGEIGLDYHYKDGAPRDVQKEVFIRQIEIAKRVNKPIIIHDRDAHGDMMEIMRKYAPDVQFVLHCYSGSYEWAVEMIRLGAYISFSGTMVFPKSSNLKKSAGNLPLERLFVETDSPYLAPNPYRGKRNEPAYVYYVAEEMARLRGMETEEIARITTKNGKNFFGIMD